MYPSVDLWFEASFCSPGWPWICCADPPALASWVQVWAIILLWKRTILDCRSTFTKNASLSSLMTQILSSGLTCWKEEANFRKLSFTTHTCAHTHCLLSCIHVRAHTLSSVTHALMRAHVHTHCLLSHMHACMHMYTHTVFCHTCTCTHMHAWYFRVLCFVTVTRRLSRVCRKRNYSYMKLS